MPCLDCGRPSRGATRCEACEPGHRGTTAQRGYGSEHQAERKRWEPYVEQGSVHCRRCGELIEPGDEWDMGHDDADRTLPAEPEHARRCNRAAAGRARHSG